MKVSFQKKLAVFMLIACMALLQTQGIVQAASYRGTDVKAPSEGNVLMGVEGSYEYVGKSKIIKRINEIRKEACENGYLNPSTKKKLTMDDYVPMKWSSDLEWIAQIRAAEATVNESHTRPNGTSCFSLKHNGVQSWAENLAWNYSGLMQGIEQWYGEKDDWVNQVPGTVTGHYTSLINPSYKYVGMGSFCRSTGGWYGVSAEFGWERIDNGKKSSLKGKTVQAMEVKSAYVNSVEIQAPTTLNVGKTKKITVTGKVTYPGIMGGQNVTEGTIWKNIKWSSSKKSVLAVNADGKLRAKKAGKSVISAKIAGVKTVRATVKVNK